MSLNGFKRRLMLPFLTIGAIGMRSGSTFSVPKTLEKKAPPISERVSYPKGYRKGKHNGSAKSYFNNNLRKRRAANKAAKLARKNNRERK